MTTLISLIGTGQRDLTGTSYQQTRYVWPDDTATRPTAIFTGAVIEHLRPDAVVILGTRTSAWAALIETYRDDLADLFLRLDTKGAITDDLLTETATALQRVWHIPVTCQAVCDRDVTAANAAGILVACAQAFPTTGLAILDVTHCFRSVALLAQAAAHLLESIHPKLTTRILYGDLITHAARAAQPAKNGDSIANGKAIELSTLGRAAELSAALRSVFLALDFEPLADWMDDPELKRTCQAVATALRSLDFDGLTSKAQPFRTRLDQADDPLLSLVAPALDALIKPLTGRPLDQTLITLARYACDRHLWSLALFAGVEAGYAQAVRGARVTSDAELDEAYQSSLRALTPGDREALAQLKQARNQSAHGSHLIDRKPLDPKAVLQRALPILKRLIDH